MPARVTVWCRRPVEADLGALYAELGAVDWLSIGEGFEVSEAAIEEALGELAVAGDTLEDAEIRWGPERPLQIRRLRGELLEETRVEQEAVPAAAAGCVAEAVEAWDLEVGWTQADGFGGAVAWVVGRWLAEQGDGLVDLYGEAWRDAGGETIG